MRTIIILMSVAIIYSCADAQDKMAFNIDNSGIALEGYSPVSYLDLGKAEIGSKEFKSKYKSVAYYFTSSEQKKKFDSNPEKYLPQYGGFCAFGIYAGAKFRVDPDNFLVKDGKYYLYLNDVEVNAKDLWIKEDHDNMVESTNANWEKLSKTYN